MIVPSEDVATRLARYFPDQPDRHSVGSISSDDCATPAAWQDNSRRRDRRDQCLEGLSGPSGLRARRCQKKAPNEFLVIGYTENDEPLMRTGKAFVTGKFGEDEVAGIACAGTASSGSLFLCLARDLVLHPDSCIKGEFTDYRV